MQTKNALDVAKYDFYQPTVFEHTVVCGSSITV